MSTHHPYPPIIVSSEPSQCYCSSAPAHVPYLLPLQLSLLAHIHALCRDGKRYRSGDRFYCRLPMILEGEEKIWDFARRELGIDVACQFGELMAYLNKVEMEDRERGQVGTALQPQNWNIRSQPQNPLPIPAYIPSNDPYLAGGGQGLQQQGQIQDPQNPNHDMYPLTPPPVSSPVLQSQSRVDIPFRHASPGQSKSPVPLQPLQIEPPRPPPYRNPNPRRSPMVDAGALVAREIEQLLSSYPVEVVREQLKAALERVSPKEKGNDSIQEVAARIEIDVAALKKRAGGRDLVTSLFWRNSL